MPDLDASVMVWDEALRLLLRQEAEIDNLRTRSTALLSAAAVAAALFAARMPSRTVRGWHHDCLIAALVLFVLMTAAIAAIHWPRRFVFSAGLEHPVDLMESGSPPDIAAFTSNRSRWALKARESNRRPMTTMYKFMIVACVLFGAQVVAWGAALL